MARSEGAADGSGWLGDAGADGVEAVLVGGVGERYEDSLRSVVLEGTLLHHHVVLAVVGGTQLSSLNKLLTVVLRVATT